MIAFRSVLRAILLCVAAWAATTGYAPAADAALDAGGSLTAADREFFDCIATRPRDLEGLLSADFVYRTREGGSVGKTALIARLSSGMTRVRAPKIEHASVVDRSPTGVSTGIIELEVESAAGWQVVRSRFTHVWIFEGERWRLLYRESQ